MWCNNLLTIIWTDEDVVASPSLHVSSNDGHLCGKSYEVLSMDWPFRWDGRPGDYTSTLYRDQGSLDRAYHNVCLWKKRYTADFQLFLSSKHDNIA